MREPLTYKLTKKIQSINELKVGGYYEFFDILFQYCAGSDLFPGTCAFSCRIGQFFIYRVWLEELINDGKIHKCKILEE